MPKIKNTRKNLRYHWSVTTSLPVKDRTPDKISEFKLKYDDLKTKYNKYFDKFIFQLEMTENNNYHYQGYGHSKIGYNNAEIFASQSKDLASHLSLASANGIQQLKDYCMKPERISGPFGDQEFDRVYALRYKPVDLVLRPFQEELKNYLLAPNADDRKIMVVVDPEGGSGKSKFAKYMYDHKVFLIEYSNTEKAKNAAADELPALGCIVDMSRCKPKDVSNGDIYAALESIKNGYFRSTFRQNRMVIVNPPNMVIFTNHKPDLSSLSADKWDLKLIDRSNWTLHNFTSEIYNRQLTIYKLKQQRLNLV